MPKPAPKPKTKAALTAATVKSTTTKLAQLMRDVERMDAKLREKGVPISSLGAARTSLQSSIAKIQAQGPAAR